MLINFCLPTYIFTAQPRVAIYREIQRGYRCDIQVHPDLPTSETIVAIRFEGSLYFANVCSYFEDAILGAVSDKPNAKYVLGSPLQNRHFALFGRGNFTACLSDTIWH
ncbi:MAG: hypothetical protein DRQ99_25005 [Candidatus Parabeggiatoa sp. nov. 3]|nr:MAG: hypothetical protein DRQ99_25005 [Gammaproteobacteria bacterium]